jgi:integrase/recombinase XerD
MKQKYTFNESIIQELEKLETHLRTNKYNVSSIRQHKNYTGIYIEWLNEYNLKVEEVNYKILTEFIQEIRERYSTNQSRRIILAVRHYYDSLGLEKNPASGVYIRGHRKSILNDIISYEDLKTMLDTYETLNDRQKRNKVILGVLINQAITTEELHQLEPHHIKLKEGKIFIPGHGETNSRTLDLEASQMLELQEYLLIIRPRMLANLTSCRSGRKPSKISDLIHDKLFFSENGNDEIKTSLYHLFRAIKKTYPKITSAKKIRATVIAEWLKTIDIRKVQYMAGHRYVSSTERYNVMNLQELKDSLNKYHPMK